MRETRLTSLIRLSGVLLVFAFLASCTFQPNRPSTAYWSNETPENNLPSPVSSGTSTPTMPVGVTEKGTAGLTEDQVATLRSLKQVDDHPLYTMQYFGSYRKYRTIEWGDLRPEVASEFTQRPTGSQSAWGCSLFAALGDAENRLYGRNFDWRYSPALLLFADPPDGYASVSMVDIEYLGFSNKTAGTLLDLSLSELALLLESPWIPFDGMNEHGLAVGMAAVPPGEMGTDPQKETVGSVEVIREILDQASDVEEAVIILGRYNVDMGGGPPIHYLVADASGAAALVEFYQRQMMVFPNPAPWHQATNFLLAATNGKLNGQCWRYDEINQRLSERQGRLTFQDAMDLLAQVAQDNTQWSVVYGLTAGNVGIVLDRQYEEMHEFRIEP